jgi:1,4-alpha-glucan branching enzyme
MGMITGRGIPMLWQGQEFGENYFVPLSGWGRVMLYRPVRWDYFYDPVGKAMISLVRKLLAMRRQEIQFREGDHYFYNHYDNYQSKQLLLFSRSRHGRFSLIALNFGDDTQWAPFTFPVDGNFKEALHGGETPGLNIGDVRAGEQRRLEIPGNYGRIWTAE